MELFQQIKLVYRVRRISTYNYALVYNNFPPEHKTLIERT